MIARLLLLALCVAPLGAGAQIQRLAAPDTLAGNHFGGAVALDGERLLVGAGGEASCGANAGAAYLYERQPDGRFGLAARFGLPECEAERFFGASVALSGDVALVSGTQRFLGDQQPNPVVVYERAPGVVWHEAARLAPAGPSAALGFGSAHALDGERAVVSAEGAPELGRPGAAFVFERGTDGTWRQTAVLTGGGRFGASVVLDGARLAVSAPGTTKRRGSLHLYSRTADGRWLPEAVLDGFKGNVLTMALSGDILVAGLPTDGRAQRGRAEVFARKEDGQWRREAVLEPHRAYDFGAFGSAVALSADRILVAGYTEQINLPFNIDRVVYVFHRERGASWRQRHIIDVGTPAFGLALDLDGRTALIGEAGDHAPGAAYLVRLF